MDLQCTCNSLSGGQTTLEANNRFYNFSQMNHTAFSSEESTDITIMTKDGDKVTLSADIGVEASSTTYNSRALTNATYTESRGKLNSFDVSRQIDIAVEGVLDEQEKEEIEQVIKAISEMISDFLSGKSDRIDEKSNGFADLGTISDVEADFEIRTSVTSVRASAAKYAVYSAYGELPEPSMTNSHSANDGAGPVNRLTERMLRRVKDSGIRPEKFFEPAERMFAERSQRLQRRGWAGRRAKAGNRRIRANFFQKLKKLAAGHEGRELRGGVNAGMTDGRAEVAFSAEAVNLQIETAELKNSFKLVYSAGNQPESVT
jgi:hypothetical protein